MKSKCRARSPAMTTNLMLTAPTTVEIKDIGTTKVVIPEEAQKKNVLITGQVPQFNHNPSPGLAPGEGDFYTPLPNNE